MSGYNFVELSQEAQFRWLRPAELLFILQNYEKIQLTHEPPQKPPSGSLSLFNRRVVRFFRKDGHSWRKKKDGKTVKEAYERLKVGNIDALNCYYAHGEENPNFQRRSYWMLEPAMDHIVLVHYRAITVTKSWGHQAPSISDMARDNMSWEGTHSYSRDQSAPSWNALNKRDSSTMMIDSDNVQEFSGDDFGSKDFSEVSSTSKVQGEGHYTTREQGNTHDKEIDLGEYSEDCDGFLSEFLAISD